MNAKHTREEAIELTASAAYRAYVEAVGGKSVRGEPLPTWEQLKADPSKQQVVEGWRAAGVAAVGAFQNA